MKIQLFVYVIKWFRVQFGINKRKQIFQRLQKIARACRASAIVVFEKFASAYLFQIAREK